MPRTSDYDRHYLERTDSSQALLAGPGAERRHPAPAAPRRPEALCAQRLWEKLRDLLLGHGASEFLFEHGGHERPASVLVEALRRSLPELGRDGCFREGPAFNTLFSLGRLQAVVEAVERGCATHGEAIRVPFLLRGRPDGCRLCGQPFHYDFDGRRFVAAPCPIPDTPFHVHLDVPSGRLVFAADLRPFIKDWDAREQPLRARFTAAGPPPLFLRLHLARLYELLHLAFVDDVGAGTVAAVQAEEPDGRPLIRLLPAESCRAEDRPLGMFALGGRGCAFMDADLYAVLRESGLAAPPPLAILAVPPGRQRLTYHHYDRTLVETGRRPANYVTISPATA